MGRSVLIATIGDLFDFASVGELASTKGCISSLLDVLVSKDQQTKIGNLLKQKNPLYQGFVYK